MSDPSEPETPISYAQPGEPIILAKPLAMLPVNLAALAMIFMKLIASPTPSPFDTMVEFVQTVWRTHHFSEQFWDAIATAPFLLSIPLAAWTVRLCFNPIAGTSERAIVYGLSAASMTMTMLALGYCFVHLSQEPRFTIAAVGASIVLAIFLLMLWKVRGLKGTYLPALIAMTGAFAINLLLVIWVVLSHFPWCAGLVIGLLIGVAQLLATNFMVKRYSTTAM